MLAAYNQESDTFKTTTKVGTGISDLDLEKLSAALKTHKVSNVQPRVDAKVEADDWFEPSIVIEVIASEITLRPIYTAGLDIIREGSGFALRFPKFAGRIRDDKSPEDSTTVRDYWKCIRSKQDIWSTRNPGSRNNLSFVQINWFNHQTGTEQETNNKKKEETEFLGLKDRQLIFP